MSAPTEHASISMKHFQNSAVSNVPVAVMTVRGNLFGFFVENEDSDPIYLQMFNKEVGDVTPGVTAPDFSFKIPGNTVLGKDAQEFPLDHFPIALTVCVTTTRTGGVAPATAASVHFWHSQR